MPLNISTLKRRFVSILAFAIAFGPTHWQIFAQASQAVASPVLASQPAPDPPARTWQAGWITHPTAPLREPIVLHFRRVLTLATVPTSYLVRVSADNRFILYVNGHRVGDGPARGDLLHWRYERFDLAPFLQPGANLINATVWNFGILAPLAQISDRTAFLLESESGAPSDRSSSLGSEADGPDSINTGVSKSINAPDNGRSAWQVEVEPGHRPLDRSTVTLKTYFAAGPGEEIDAAHYDWDWQSPSASSGAWVPAASPMRDSIFPGVNRAHSAGTTGDNPWGLIPDELPPMEHVPTDPGKVRLALQSFAIQDPGSPGNIVAGTGAPSFPLKDFPTSAALIPAGTHLHILLDRKTLTTAYPRLTVSGGKGSKITLTYSEALYDKDQHKGDRDEVAGRTALGLTDRFLPDGGAHRVFEPLWWRTWRYLDLDIETADEPLKLESLTANFTCLLYTSRCV